MRNYKTTIIGVLAIIVAVASAAKSYLATGSVPDLTALTTAVLAGWGLVMAKDASARL
jgi:hypothetical protein